MTEENKENTGQDKNDTKKIALIIAVALIIIVTVGILAVICVEESIEEKYDNSEFASWAAGAADDTSFYIEHLSGALKTYDGYSIHSWAEQLEDVADDYKNDCYSFTVSPEWEYVQDEFYSYLTCVSWAGFHSKWAGEYMQDGFYDLASADLELATDSVSEAAEHLDNMSDFLEL